MFKNQNIRVASLCVLAMAAMLASCGAEELIACWKFDQKGDEFENLVGNSEPAKVQPKDQTNGLSLVADKVGGMKQVIEFDGSGNSWISTPSKSAGDDFTIELWIKVNDRDQHSIVLGNASGIIIKTHPKGKLAFLLATGVDGEAWSYAEIPDAINPDQWIHVMARFAEFTQQLFVEDGNRVLRSQAVKIDNPKQFNWARTVLGINEFDKTDPFSGRIAALKIYSGALSEENFRKSMP